MSEWVAHIYERLVTRKSSLVGLEGFVGVALWKKALFHWMMALMFQKAPARARVSFCFQIRVELSTAAPPCLLP